MIKRLNILFVIIVFMMHCSFRNDNNLQGTYCKIQNSTKIYLKIKNINDSLYYFLLKDYDTTKDDYEQRSITGTFIYSKKKIKLLSADFYLGGYYFSLIIKGDKKISIDTSQFHMYYSFDDIIGDYIKTSDSVNINYNDFVIRMISNNTDVAKKKFGTQLYEFPNKYSKSDKEQFDQNEKIFVIITVGDLFDNNDTSSTDISRFSLIEIPKTNERKWINTDELEDNFK